MKALFTFILCVMITSLTLAQDSMPPPPTPHTTWYILLAMILVIILAAVGVLWLCVNQARQNREDRLRQDTVLSTLSATEYYESRNHRH